MITKAQANRLRKFARLIDSASAAYEQTLAAYALKLTTQETVHDQKVFYDTAWSRFEGELRDITEAKS